MHTSTEKKEEEKDNKVVFDYDVVVMGAGPAAFSLALQFAKQDPTKGPVKTLAILSSNPAENENNHYDMTKLMQGKLSGLLAQEKYKDYLYMGRLREFGGTTNHWGGWSWPIEQYEVSNWPIEYAELEKYWKMTQYDVMNLGSKEHPQYKYDDIEWWIKEGKKLDEEKKSQDHEWESIPETNSVKTRILQVHPINFKEIHLKTIQECRWITIHHNCNVVQLETIKQGDECRVTTMIAKEILEGGNVGRTFYFNARDFVLGAGAIENTRFLLLNQTEQFPNGIGNSSGHLGKHFRDQNFFNNYEIMSFTLKDDCPPGIRNFYFNLNGNNLYGDSAFTATLVPKVEFLKEKKIGTFRCVFGGVDQTPQIGIIAASVEAQALPSLNLKDPNGFIELTDALPVDIFGQKRVNVHWDLPDITIETAKVMFDEIFKILAPYIDPNKINKPDMETFTNKKWCPDLHPAGTTRMAKRREDGVVDSNLRVFDTTNLYVTGSCTFPSSGYENPTFTICALAVRLADHLISKKISSPLLVLTRNISTITIDSTLHKLQQALMLELSTIPLYLSAMYSLVKPEKKEESVDEMKEATNLITNLVKKEEPMTWYDFAYPRFWSIIKQEMLHMALVANVMNGIVGGSPKFNDKTQIPQYPGIGLPGGCLQSMKYSLGPFTMKRVLEIFMRIEHPRQIDRIVQQVKARMIAKKEAKENAKANEPFRFGSYLFQASQFSHLSDELWDFLEEVFKDFPKNDRTIGDFYEEIVEELRYLDAQYGDELWKGTTGHQVTAWGYQLGGKMIQVVDLATALEAITEVVKEGEGFTIPTSPGDGQCELAHFFKFAELYKRKVIVRSEEGYSFDQKEIPFSQEKDVINMITLDEKIKYTGKIAAANFGFNVAYNSLLDGLEQAFNGQPSRVPMMVDIPNDFKNTMSYQLDDGHYACPTFEWVEVTSLKNNKSKAFSTKISPNACPITGKGNKTNDEEKKVEITQPQPVVEQRQHRRDCIIL